MSTIIRLSPQLIDKRKDDGFNALHLAALNGHLDIVKELVENVNNLTNIYDKCWWGVKFYILVSAIIRFPLYLYSVYIFFLISVQI